MKLLHCVTLLLSLHFVLTNEVFKPFVINKLGNEKNTYALNAGEKLYKDEENTEIGSNRDVFVYKVDNIPVIGARKRNEETHNPNNGIEKLNNINRGSAILINARRGNGNAKDRGKTQKKKDNKRILVSNNGVTDISEEIERSSKISWLYQLFRYISKIIHSSKARLLDVRQIIYDKDTGTMVVNRGANRFRPYYVYVPKEISPEHDDRGNDSEESNKKKRNNGNAGGSNKEYKTENPDNINSEERVTEEHHTNEEGTGGIEISNFVQDVEGDLIGNITINGKTYRLDDFKNKNVTIKL